MYPQTNTTTECSSSNDILSEESRSKWKGLLVNSLQKVQKQVHPTLSAKDEALEYIENLILQLLEMLCASQPHNVQDVEDRVQKTFPAPIEKWASSEAQSALDKGKKKSQLVLPVDKIHPLIKEALRYKFDHQVTVYVVAVLEYIAADILKLTGNYVKNIKHQEIIVQDIKVAMCADKVLMDMFFQDEEEEFTIAEEHHSSVSNESNKYEDIVKDLVLEETQYMRDLIMIIKVFREPFATLFPTSKDIENIFSNILDVHELSYNLLSSLEDTLEVNEDSGEPLVGACFEDMAEGAEFDVYFKYTEDILSPIGKERLNALLERKDVSADLKSKGYGFKDVVRYVLPKLLLGPIFHCLHYFDVLQNLKIKSTDEEDQESLNNAYSVMHQLKVDIERKLNSANLLKRKSGDFMTLRFQGRADKEVALRKMNDLQKQIDGWEGKNIGQSCHEFIMEGVLFKYAGRKQAERYVFLFDGLMIFTKQNLKGRSSVTGSTSEYKLKEKFNMRRIDCADREDSEEVKNSFELVVRDHPNIILVAKSAEEKANWMAALISLLRRSFLERMLDTKLSEEAKQQPLRLPSPDIYQFADDDSEENIVFEDGGTTDNPIIKGGNLVKLVERLTYHMYAEPKFVKTFLTTFRTFCKPPELLELLTDSTFSIPDPPFNVDAGNPKEQALALTRDDLKRFKKEYAKPVQFRVLNVLRHWVDHHWCDFDWNRNLLTNLVEFLDSVKAMKKWVDSIKKIIKRKLELGNEIPKQITFPHDKPTIEWHIAKSREDFELMKLHPIEIARQVTLLEFDLYRAVKPSELVGTVWMKKQKNITSPNLLRMIDHSTRFTFWLEKCIIESECFEERVSVVSRILEIMVIFQELNNFNGVLEVVGALNSAPVHRLEHTFEEVDQKHHKLMKAFDDAKELNSDHFKKYYEKLRSINPPCVPFLGNYLTNILLTEEGNPDFLPNRPEGIINFSKRRKVAAICGEIQQYQNQPYCLEKEDMIRSYFTEDLNPLGDLTEKDFNDYLFYKSLEIEPRNAKQPAKFEKKYNYSLKSPGIKPSSRTLKYERSHMSLNDTQRLHRLNEEDELISNSRTPPTTPNTPLTPPSDSVCDTNSCVFAMVQLPNSDTASMASSTLTLTNSDISSLILNSSYASQLMTLSAAPSLSAIGAQPPTLPPSMPTQLQEEIPPPLPPRRKKDRESGCEQLSPTRTVAPQLPIKANSSKVEDIPPPPLPPRVARERGGSLGGAPGDPNLFHLHGNMTLPRSLHRTQYHPNAVTTLPRRNSERDYLSQTQFVNVNGERGGSVTPELPPKTYNRSVIHSRQQSS